MSEQPGPSSEAISSESVVLSAAISRRQFMRFLRSEMRRPSRSFLIVIGALLVVGSAVVGLVFGSLLGWRGGLAAAGLGALALVLCGLLLRLVGEGIGEWGRRRAWADRADIHTLPGTVVVDSTGMLMVLAESDTRIAWSEIDAAAATGDVLGLRINHGAWLVVGLPDDVQRAARLRALVTEHVSVRRGLG